MCFTVTLVSISCFFTMGDGASFLCMILSVARRYLWGKVIRSPSFSNIPQASTSRLNSVVRNASRCATFGVEHTDESHRLTHKLEVSISLATGIEQDHCVHFKVLHTC